MNPRFGREGWSALRNSEFDMPHICPERVAGATSASPDVAFKDEGLAGDADGNKGVGVVRVGQQKSKPRDVTASDLRRPGSCFLLNLNAFDSHCPSVSSFLSSLIISRLDLKLIHVEV